MRQKVLSEAFCFLHRSKQRWQPSFEEGTPPAASDVPWHEAKAWPEGVFYQYQYLKGDSYLTTAVLQWCLEEVLGVQMSLWSNGRWEKQDGGILQRYTEWGQALQSLILCHQWQVNGFKWLHREEIPSRTTAQALPCLHLQKHSRLHPCGWDTSPWHYWQNSLLIYMGQGQSADMDWNKLSGELAVLAGGFHNSQGKYLK